MASVSFARSPTRSLRVLVALLAVLVLIASPPVARAGGDVQIVVRSLSFDPPEVSVSRGSTVTWQNTTSPDRVHDVVSSIEDAFGSPLFRSGESWAYRFTAAGTYTYICSIHDVMIGAVHVPLTGRVAERPDGTAMRIRLAKTPLPADSPFRYVILRRDPGRERFVIWAATREAVIEFQPPAPGSYEFVMRLRNTDSDRQTGPAGDSPVLRLDWDG